MFTATGKVSVHISESWWSTLKQETELVFHSLMLDNLDEDIGLMPANANVYDSDMCNRKNAH